MPLLLNWRGRIAFAEEEKNFFKCENIIVAFRVCVCVWGGSLQGESGEHLADGTAFCRACRLPQTWKETWVWNGPWHCSSRFYERAAMRCCCPLNDWCAHVSGSVGQGVYKNATHARLIGVTRQRCQKRLNTPSQCLAAAIGMNHH